MSETTLVHRAYVLLGGNLGEVQKTFARALERMQQLTGHVEACSRIFRTQAWGMEGGDPFLNQAVLLLTSLSPGELMNQLLEIERHSGRTRTPGLVEPRTLDLDILLYDQLVAEGTGLHIPHPRMHLRRFALLPLKDIAPGVIHPVFNKTIGELVADCPDLLAVAPIGPGADSLPCRQGFQTSDQ